MKEDLTPTPTSNVHKFEKLKENWGSENKKTSSFKKKLSGCGIGDEDFVLITSMEIEQIVRKIVDKVKMESYLSTPTNNSDQRPSPMF